MRKLVEQLICFTFKIVGHFQKKKLVYFESFHGKQYSDNPRAIYQFMKKHYPDYTLIWGVSKGYEAMFEALRIPFVTRFSIKWFFIMPRAAFWVINTRTPLWLAKNKKTVYLQTWHGTPLKKIGCDIPDVKIPGYTKESYLEEFTKEAKRWDLLLSPNAYSSEIFRQAFRYNGIIKEYGYPRNDQLVNALENQKKCNLLKEKIGVSLDKKIVLYAPTWRETEQWVNGHYEFTQPFPFEKLIEVFGEEVVFLVRMHYLVAQQFDFSSNADQMIDVSDYLDMSDLLLVSDLLITDYSSCMFDYVLTDRPIIYYLPDQEDYQNELRGFYFDLEQELPGPIVVTPVELIEQLKQWQVEPNRLKSSQYQTFKQKFTSCETGEAAKKISTDMLND